MMIIKMIYLLYFIKNIVLVLILNYGINLKHY